MLKTLLDRGRVLARAYSVQLAAIGAILSALAAIDPVALQSSWQTMPAELRAMIPANVATWISTALFVLVMLVRAVPQPVVTQRLGLIGNAPLPAWLRAARATVNRAIDGIVIHCLATPEGRHVDVATVRNWHVRNNGWADIGYHFLIWVDGTIEVGRPLAKVGAHVAGYNARTIGVCYVGGCAADGVTPKDTRTPAQKAALVHLLTELRAKYPKASIKGHRDYSPDRNRNGSIEANEWVKACPSFDAGREYAGLV